MYSTVRYVKKQTRNVHVFADLSRESKARLCDPMGLLMGAIVNVKARYMVTRIQLVATISGRCNRSSYDIARNVRKSSVFI